MSAKNILTLAILMLIYSSISLAHEQNFTCELQVSANSKFLKLKSKNEGDSSGCTINFSPLQLDTAGGMKVTLLIMPRKDIQQSSASAGFKSDNGSDWNFSGYAFANPPYKYSNITFSKDQKKDDLTLIGRQTESATSPQGDSIVLNGISIFRIAPNFLVSTQLSFESDTSEATRKSVETDLINIVESLQATRNNAAPSK
jgi:hypothetical protein